MDTKVETGNKIIVDYVGRDINGKIFDTSIKEVAKNAEIFNPQRNYEEGLSFIVGAGQMIKGFDEAVIGMRVGETKTVEIPPEKAYGERDKNMIIRIPLKEVGDVSKIKVGMKLIVGEMYPATVTNITDKEIEFDLNHELAGQKLIFDITIKSIESN